MGFVVGPQIDGRRSQGMKKRVSLESKALAPWPSFDRRQAIEVKVHAAGVNARHQPLALVQDHIESSWLPPEFCKRLPPLISRAAVVGDALQVFCEL